MDEFWIAITSLIVAAVFHFLRYAGSARLARIRQVGARMLNLVLAAIAAVVLVHSLNIALIAIDTAIVYCVSSVGESWIVWLREEARRHAES